MSVQQVNGHGYGNGYGHGYGNGYGDGEPFNLGYVPIDGDVETFLCNLHITENQKI